MTKPTVFIGSSNEGLEFARAVRALLARDAETTLWNEGFFGLGNTFIETLINSLTRFDFAILILTPDDLLKSRKIESMSPRDNVLFELGLFMGHLGRSRTFIVYEANAGVKIPSDLLGMTMATYEWPRADGNHKAAVGVACDNIRDIIRDLGASEKKIAAEIDDIKARQVQQQLQIEALQFLLMSFIPYRELGHLWGLKLNKPFPFEKSTWFEAELRHLRDIGLIQGKQGVSVGGLPENGDLKDYFSITEAGLRYLDYRQQFEALGSERAGRNLFV